MLGENLKPARQRSQSSEAPVKQIDEAKTPVNPRKEEIRTLGESLEDARQRALNPETLRKQAAKERDGRKAD